MSDERQSAHLYKLFANGGAAGTQYNLGVSYERGRDGLPQVAYCVVPGSSTFSGGPIVAS